MCASTVTRTARVGATHHGPTCPAIHQTTQPHLTAAIQLTNTFSHLLQIKVTDMFKSNLTTLCANMVDQVWVYF